MPLDEYFKQTDTPSRGSPVGLMMERILNESPELDFETCRKMAQEQLLKAAKRKSYRPQTPKQEAKRLERFKRRPV